MQACSSDEDTAPETEAPEWNYENSDWTSLGYSECSGKVESPINIETDKTIKTPLEPLHFTYQNVPLDILNNGHTIQVKVQRGNYITLNNGKYQLLQFHFHHLSEHQVNGVASEMELHLVHQDSISGNIAVVGVFLKKGAANAELAKVFDNLPTVKDQEKIVNNTINLVNLLPQNQQFYNYTGSLTTPPCSQGLDWFVLKTPVEVSEAQIASFTQLFQNNARPVQALNNRPVLESM